MHASFGASFARARELFHSGEYGEAIGVLRVVLTDNPDNSAAHTYMALALECVGRYEEALASLDAAIEIEPDNARALMSKGGLLLEKLNRFSEAIPLFERVIALKPSFLLDAYVFRGVAFRYLSMHDKARASFSEAIRQEVREGDARALYHKARALSFLGRKQEAIETLRKAFGLGRRHCRAEDARREDAFRNLRSEQAFIELVGG